MSQRKIKLKIPAHHNYFPKLERLANTGSFPPGTITNVYVRHDDWCAIFDGGVCNCTPDIELDQDAGRN